jgi:hypothetical protein
MSEFVSERSGVMSGVWRFGMATAGRSVFIYVFLYLFLFSFGPVCISDCVWMVLRLLASECSYTTLILSR